MKDGIAETGNKAPCFPHGTTARDNGRSDGVLKPQRQRDGQRQEQDAALATRRTRRGRATTRLTDRTDGCGTTIRQSHGQRSGNSSTLWIMMTTVGDRDREIEPR
jgi:hypothetical protein